MMWGYPGYGAGSWVGMIVMMFFGLVFTVGFVLLIVWLARSGLRGPEPYQYQAGSAAACDIAKQRYARGEITKEQFDEICRTVSR